MCVARESRIKKLTSARNTSLHGLWPCARTHGSVATPAQGRITHKYVIQDYACTRFKGGLRSKPPSHTRKREGNLDPDLSGAGDRLKKREKGKEN